MAGMSNCHVDLRTTRSAAQPLSPPAVLGFAMYALSACQSRHCWRWKTTMWCEMITSFSVFWQPLQYIIHFPIQHLIYAKNSHPAIFLFSSPNYLILPVIQHITSYQCVRKLYLLSASGLQSYLFSSMACCSETKKKKKRTKMSLTMNSFHESVRVFLQHY